MSPHVTARAIALRLAASLMLACTVGVTALTAPVAAATVVDFEITFSDADPEAGKTGEDRLDIKEKDGSEVTQVTISIPRRTTAADKAEEFRKVLAHDGFSVERDGGTLKIKNQRADLIVELSKERTKQTADLVTRKSSTGEIISESALLTARLGGMFGGGSELTVGFETGLGSVSETIVLPGTVGGSVAAAAMAAALAVRTGDLGAIGVEGLSLRGATILATGQGGISDLQGVLGGTDAADGLVRLGIATMPVPAGIWLIGSAMAALGFCRRSGRG